MKLHVGMSAPTRGHTSLTTLVLVMICLLSLALTSLTFGQTETGAITGTVTDSTGAVISGATVQVTGVNTGLSRSVITNSTGLYTVPSLQPGVYEVAITQSGFAVFKQQVTVTVGSRLSVDAKLQPGGKNVQVEVTASDVAEVNTESPSLSQVVNSTSIVELPTITRNAYALVATAGNVTTDPNGSAGRGAGVAINGQRAASTDLLLDGGENVDTFTATVGQNVPLDSVQEFRVMTNNFTAEYGRASGGVINVATKSGSNSFHGTAYEFYRGAALSANTPENKAAGCPDACSPLPRNNFVRNQFGYSIGGPIMKNKLFFFDSSEWIRVRSSESRQYWVPTPQFIGASAAATQSFFSTYGKLVAPIGETLTKDQLVATGAAGAGTAGTPWGDLAGSTPVMGLVTVPIPTDVGGGSPQNTVENVSRIDFNLSQTTQMYGRYALAKSNYFAGTISDSPYAGFLTGENVMNQNFLFSVTHIFSNSFVSQSKVVYNRLNDLQPLNGPPTPTLFFKGSRSVISGKRAYLPGYLPGSPGSGIPFGGPQNVYQFFQDFSLTHGNHNFRFGGMYLHLRDNRVFGAYEEASEQLGTTLTSGLNNFLAGQLVSYRAALDPQGKYPCAYDYTTHTYVQDSSCLITLPARSPKFGRNNRYNDFAFYGQDTWKVVPRLTLTLGVRYEYYGVQHNADPSLDSNFYFGSGSNYFQQYRNGQVMLAQNSPVGGLWAPDRNNFAPRVGFAWDVFGDGRTSLRGGYGIAYERNFGNVTFNVIQNPPNYAVISLSPADVGGNLPIATANLGSFQTSTGSKPLIAPSLRHVSQNIVTAYSEMWNLSLERQVAQNTVLAFEYSGSHGLKLYTLEDPNRLGSGVIYLGDTPTGGFGGPRLNQRYGVGSFNRANRGFSHYNALNIRLQSSNLLKTGFQTTINYSWSHAIDNLSSTFSDSYANYNVGLLDPFNPALDKGSADFDIRHRLVISGVWQEPWMKAASGFSKYVLGGWELAPIITIRSGTPFSLWDFTNGYFYGNRAMMTGTPSLTAGGGAGQVMGANLYQYMSIPTDVGDYYNPLTLTSEFGMCTVPGQGAQGPCPWPSNMSHRNTFLGPRNWSFDTGIYKNIPINERVHLQVRGEFYNLFNHPNNYIEVNSLDLSSCGSGPITCIVPVKKGYLPDGTADKRDVQLGLKIIF